MSAPLTHRIRAAGLLVRDDRILLVKHVVGDDTYWIPPGGGFESVSDQSTRDTVRREFMEETGLDVDVGPLVYVREFAEPAMGRFHMELFYRIDAWRGELSLANLAGLGGDEFALVVGDTWQGKGIGRRLLERLCGAARTAGYKALYGHILEANHDMLALARHLGFVEASRGGAEVTVVRRL